MIQVGTMNNFYINDSIAMSTGNRAKYSYIVNLKNILYSNINDTGMTDICLRIYFRVKVSPYDKEWYYD